MVKLVPCFALIACLPMPAQLVTVETRPMTEQAVQFHAADVRYVFVPAKEDIYFATAHVETAPGHEGKLPQRVLTYLDKDGAADELQQTWMLWADDYPNLYPPTVPIHDGDWIVFEHGHMAVYSAAAFERAFVVKR